MEANIIDDITVAIIWSLMAGTIYPAVATEGRPSGRHVIVVIADNRPAFLEHVNHCSTDMCGQMCISARTYVCELIIAFLIVRGDYECFSRNPKGCQYIIQ